MHVNAHLSLQSIIGSDHPALCTLPKLWLDESAIHVRYVHSEDIHWVRIEVSEVGDNLDSSSAILSGDLADMVLDCKPSVLGEEEVEEVEAGGQEVEDLVAVSVLCALPLNT